ncbi:MAG: protein phosphatase 2C domain-containing protein [Bacteroidota bacterium]
MRKLLFFLPLCISTIGTVTAQAYYQLQLDYQTDVWVYEYLVGKDTIYLHHNEIFLAKEEEQRQDTICLQFAQEFICIPDSLLKEIHPRLSATEFRVDIDTIQVGDEIHLDFSDILSERTPTIWILPYGERSAWKRSYNGSKSCNLTNTPSCRIWARGLPSLFYENDSLFIPKTETVSVDSNSLIEQEHLEHQLNATQIIVSDLEKALEQKENQSKKEHLFFVLLLATSLFGCYFLFQKVDQLRIVNRDLQAVIAGVKTNYSKEILKPIALTEQVTSKRTFGMEILVSAGPRKMFSTEDNDLDLGEDIGGCLQLGDRLYFWVLDGTSQSAILRNSKQEDLFSSRYLAQSIAAFLQQSLRRTNGQLPVRTALLESIEGVRQEWEKNINALTEERKTKILNFLIDNIHATCSTTVLVGCLTLEGELKCCRIGDSFLFAYDKNDGLVPSALSTKPGTERYDRQFFRLQRTIGEDQVKVVSNEIQPEFWSITDIQRVVVVSDGVGISTRTWLKHLDALNNPQNYRSIVGKIPQATQDDKTFLIVEIIEQPNESESLKVEPNHESQDI